MELGIQASHGATELDKRFDDPVSRDGMYGSTQMAIDHIEQMMSKEENEHVLNQINVTVNESTFGIGLEDLGFSREQILIDELEHIAKGNEDLPHENFLKPSTTLLDRNESGIDEVKILNNQEEHIGFEQNVITKSENASHNMCDTFDSPLGSTKIGESSNPRADYEVKHSPTKTKLLDTVLIIQQKEREMENTVFAGGSDKYPSLNAEVEEIEEGEQHSNMASETIDVSSDNIIAEASKYNHNYNLQSSSPEANAMIVQHEMLTKDEELKTSHCKSDAADSSNYMTEDEDNEEGEISGDYGVDANSMDMVLQDAGVLEGKKVYEQHKSRCLVDYKELHCIAATVKDFQSTCFLAETVSNASNGGVELRESDRNKMVKMQQDAEPQNKKKRGRPSEEKRAKKKVCLSFFFFMCLLNYVYI